MVDDGGADVDSTTAAEEGDSTFCGNNISRSDLGVLQVEHVTTSGRFLK